MSDLPKTKIDIALDKLQETISVADVVRQGMITTLRAETDVVQLNSNQSSATVLDAKMNIFKTLDDLLKSTVHDANIGVKSLLIKQDSETNESAKNATLELLKAISVNDRPNNNEFIDAGDGNKILEEKLNAAREKHPELKLEITESELELNK